MDLTGDLQEPGGGIRPPEAFDDLQRDATRGDRRGIGDARGSAAFAGAGQQLAKVLGVGRWLALRVVAQCRLEPTHRFGLLPALEGGLPCPGEGGSCDSIPSSVGRSVPRVGPRALTIGDHRMFRDADGQASVAKAARRSIASRTAGVMVRMRESKATAARLHTGLVSA